MRAWPGSLSPGRPRGPGGPSRGLPGLGAVRSRLAAAGVATGWSVWAVPCAAGGYGGVADRYWGTTQDLLLRYRPFEADLLLLWHVPLGFGVTLCVLRLAWFRCRGESAEARRWIFASAGLSLAWLAGWAALEFLLSLADMEPWWAPGRRER